MAPNKKIKSLTSFAGTQTCGLLRIIAHMPAPLSLKLNVRSLSIDACQFSLLGSWVCKEDVV